MAYNIFRNCTVSVFTTCDDSLLSLISHHGITAVEKDIYYPLNKLQHMRTSN